jgi:uncharacterized protein YhbP (UPF0306 family)
MEHQSGYNAIYILSRLQAHHCHATDMQSTSHPASKIQQQKKDIPTILFVQITLSSTHLFTTMQDASATVHSFSLRPSKPHAQPEQQGARVQCFHHQLFFVSSR